MTTAGLQRFHWPHDHFRHWLVAIVITITLALIAAAPLDRQAAVEPLPMALPPVAMVVGISTAPIDHSVLSDPGLAAEPDPAASRRGRRGRLG